MAITVTDSSNGGYVLLNIGGAVDYRSGESIYSALIDYVQKYSGSRFLVDVSGLTGRPDILQSIQAIDAFSPERIRQIHRMAIVDPVTSRAIYLVAESLMQTRGLKIKWFKKREAATEWLLEPAA
jgi:hypothetical protein